MLPYTSEAVCIICELFHDRFSFLQSHWVEVCLIWTDTILKKYSSTVATIFTGIASAALFGHTLTINFILGISVVFISMHQVLLEKKGKKIHNRYHVIFWLTLFFIFSTSVLFTSFKGEGWTAKWDAGF